MYEMKDWLSALSVVVVVVCVWHHQEKQQKMVFLVTFWHLRLRIVCLVLVVPALRGYEWTWRGPAGHSERGSGSRKMGPTAGGINLKGPCWRGKGTF